MSIFEEDKMIDDVFLEKMGFKHNIDNPKGYFNRVYLCKFSDWGSKPETPILSIYCYYSRPNNNLYIQRSCWSHKTKKHKVYNQDDFLRALHEHELIYVKMKENEGSSI